MTKIQIDWAEFERNKQQFLQGVAIEIQEALKDKLTKEHGKDTGALQSSIRVTVNGEELDVSMLPYWEYLEYGTMPHSVNPELLKGWARRKLGNENLAYAVAQSIKRRGTRPYPFVRTTRHQDVPAIIKRNLKQAFR